MNYPRTPDSAIRFLGRFFRLPDSVIVERQASLF